MLVKSLLWYQTDGGCDVRCLESILDRSKILFLFFALSAGSRHPSANKRRNFQKKRHLKMSQSESLLPGAPRWRDGEESRRYKKDIVHEKSLKLRPISFFLMSSSFTKTATHVAFMLISPIAAPSSSPLSSPGAARSCPWFF